MNTNAAPLQGIAQNLAQHGRYGDSMLVHMNPIEVQGIASLSPTGRLTTNPVTGQQEAFLPFLAPLLGSFLGKAVLGKTLGSLAAGAIGSGLAQWAATGDIKKGLLSGITGFGLGKILGAGSAAGEAGKNIADASTAVDLAKEGLTSTGAEIAQLGATPLDSGGFDITGLAGGQVDKVADLMAQQAVQQQALESAGQTLTGAESAYESMPFGDKLFDPFSGGAESVSAMSKAVMSPEAILPIGLGVAGGMEMDYQDALRAQAEDLDSEGRADLEQTEAEADRAIRQRIYDYGLPAQGIPPGDPRFAPRMLAAGGGLVSLNPSDYQNKRDGLARLMGEPVRMQAGGNIPKLRHLTDYQGYDLKLSPSETQSAIRGTQAISAPQMQALTASGYRPGFNPELEYFRTPDRFGNDPFPEVFDPNNPNLRPLPTHAQLSQEIVTGGLSAGAGARPAVPSYSSLMDAEYSLPSSTSPGGTVSRYRGPIASTGIAGVPTMAQAYADYAGEEGIAKLKGLDYSDFPSRSDFGSSDEGGHIEYKEAQQEWLRDKLFARPSKQPLMGGPVMPPQVTGPMLPPGTVPPIDFSAGDIVGPDGTLEQSSVYQPTTNLPEPPPPIISQSPQRRLAYKPKRGEYDSPSSYLSDLKDFMGNNVAAPPVMQPPVAPPPVQSMPQPMPLPTRQPVAPPVMPPTPSPISPRPKRSDYGAEEGMDYRNDLRAWNQSRQGSGGGIRQLADGGLVKMQDMGQVPDMPIDPALEDAAMMQADPMQEGIAAVDPAMADPMANIDPITQQLLEQTAMAILGQASPEEADVIIQAFIEQFGAEAFQEFRDQVLTSVVPNAQTEGMVEGQGDGMSDEIMGMIGDQQQVAVSPGEYIVPADVVSGIGNGSSDAGANELDSMLAEIRQSRTGMTEQPPEIDPRGAMPA